MHCSYADDGTINHRTQELGGAEEREGEKERKEQGCCFYSHIVCLC